MLKSIYSWNVTDHIRSGSTVYAVVLSGERPTIECVNDYTIGEWYALKEQDKDDRAFYVVCEPEVEKEDGDDDAG